MRATILMALLPLAACGNNADNGDIVGKGTGSVRTFDVRDFSAVNLGGSDNIAVRVGGGYSVRAEGDPRILDKLEVRRKGSELLVSRRWSMTPGQARIVVTLPKLTGAAIGGSGDMTVDRVDGGALTARIAGSGNLTLAQVATQELSVSIAGSGNLTAAGVVQRLRVQIAGSGDVSAGSLVAKQAEVRVVGSGDVRATVRGAAAVSSIGSGDVDLGRDARCTVRKVGSGEVRCGG